MIDAHDDTFLPFFKAGTATMALEFCWHHFHPPGSAALLGTFEAMAEGLLPAHAHAHAHAHATAVAVTVI
jgi:hypothetical protein